jgi:hypothetical protein
MKLIVLAFIVFIIAAPVLGQNRKPTDSSKKVAPWFVERFKLSAGFFLPVNNTDIRVGVNGGAAGTEIDFEKDLGFNQTSSSFLVNAQWRTTRRSRLSLTYYGIDRKSTHTLDRDITFEDQTYPVNASVNAFFNTTIIQFSYGYAILEKQKYEAGVMIGTHIVGGQVGISLNGTTTAAKDFGFTAPLPDLGFWGGYAFTERWAVNAEGGYLAVTIQDITGSILAYQVSVTYKATDKLDLALGYNGLNFKVDALKTNYDAHFKWGYNGPSLTATYSFGKKYWEH